MKTRDETPDYILPQSHGHGRFHPMRSVLHSTQCRFVRSSLKARAEQCAQAQLSQTTVTAVSTPLLSPARGKCRDGTPTSKNLHPLNRRTRCPIKTRKWAEFSGSWGKHAPLKYTRTHTHKKSTAHNQHSPLSTTRKLFRSLCCVVVYRWLGPNPRFASRRLHSSRHAYWWWASPLRTHNTGGNSLGLGQCVAPRVSELKRCRGEKRPMITRRAVKEWRERLRHGKAAWGPNKGTGGMAGRRAQYNPPAYLSRFPAPITTLTRRGWTRPQFRPAARPERPEWPTGRTLHGVPTLLPCVLSSIIVALSSFRLLFV